MAGGSNSADPEARSAARSVQLENRGGERAFACAHARLYAAQVAVLEADYECTVFAFNDHDSLGGMAEELLANTPARFTLIGLSLGGYVAFEIIRRQLRRLERLVQTASGFNMGASVSVTKSAIRPFPVP